VAPPLAKVEQRWTNKLLLHEFVRNPWTVIEKDDYAKRLQKKYGSLMTGFPLLSNEEIDAIFKYCNVAPKEIP